MSMTAPEVFDTTLAKTHAWLNGAQLPNSAHWLEL